MVMGRMFEGKVMGIPKRTEEDILEEVQMKRDVLGGHSAALQPMNMNSKIMGGTQMEKTEENLPSLGGAGDYQDRLDGLLGTSGGKGKSSKDITSDILGGFGNNKASSLLGSEGTNLNAKQRAEYMLGLGPAPKGKKGKKGKKFDPTENILGGFSGTPNNKVNDMFGTGPQLNKKFGKGPERKVNDMFGAKPNFGGNFGNVNDMFSKAKPAKFNPMDKVRAFTQSAPTKTKTKESNPFKNGWSTPVNVSAMLGMGGAVGGVLGKASKGADPVSKILGNTKTPNGNALGGQFDVNKILGKTGGNSAGDFDVSGKINRILGPHPKKQTGGFSQSVNVEQFLPSFGPNSSKKKGRTLGKEWAVPDFRNPSNVGMERANQQIGLTMFGDYDGDGLANAVDCDPRDKTEQGFFEKAGNFLHGKGFKDNPAPMEVTNPRQPAVHLTQPRKGPGRPKKDEGDAHYEFTTQNALQGPDGEIVMVDADGNPTDVTYEENAMVPSGTPMDFVNEGAHIVGSALQKGGAAIAGGAAAFSGAVEARRQQAGKALTKAGKKVAKPFKYGVKEGTKYVTETVDLASGKRALEKQEDVYMGEVNTALIDGQKPPSMVGTTKNQYVRKLALGSASQAEAIEITKANAKIAEAKYKAQAEIEKAEAYAEAGMGPSIYGKKGKKGALRKAASGFAGGITTSNKAMGGIREKSDALSGMMGTSTGLGSEVAEHADRLTGVVRGQSFQSEQNLNQIASIGNPQANAFKMNEAAQLGQGGGGNAGLSQMSALGGSVGQGGDFAYRVAESLGESATQAVQPGQPAPASPGVDLPTPAPRQQPPQPVAQPTPQYGQPAPVGVVPGGYTENQESLRQAYAASDPNHPPLPDGRVWSPRSRKYVRYPRGQYKDGIPGQ